MRPESGAAQRSSPFQRRTARVRIRGWELRRRGTLNECGRAATFPAVPRSLHAGPPRPSRAFAAGKPSWLLGTHDIATADEAVRRLISDAVGHLGARGMVRDPRQIWRPVLGSPDNLPGHAVA